MLKYFKENDLVQFIDRTDCNWKEAIRLSCHKLLEHDYIGEDYVLIALKNMALIS